MIVSWAFLLLATAAAAFAAHRQDPAKIGRALGFTGEQAKRLAVRLPFSFIAANCLAELIPDRLVAAVMGPDTGLIGILAASVLGGLLPGGPMVSFPLALVLAQDGAGAVQLVALITGWSVFAFHRVIAYEVPLLGWRFTVLRFVASAPVPPLAALMAAGLAGLLGLSLAFR